MNTETRRRDRIQYRLTEGVRILHAIARHCQIEPGRHGWVSALAEEIGEPRSSVDDALRGRKSMDHILQWAREMGVEE